MRRLAALFLVAAAGCGDGNSAFDGPPGSYGPGWPHQPQAAPFGLQGDWFYCETYECRVLDDDGVRFADDGIVYELDAPGSDLEPDERYCVEDPLVFYRASPSEDGTLLTIENPFVAGLDITVLVQWLIPNQRMTLPAEGIEERRALQRVFPTRIAKECETTPQPGVPPG